MFGRCVHTHILMVGRPPLPLELGAAVASITSSTRRSCAAPMVRLKSSATRSCGNSRCASASDSCTCWTADCHGTHAVASADRFRASATCYAGPGSARVELCETGQSPVWNSARTWVGSHWQARDSNTQYLQCASVRRLRLSVPLLNTGQVVREMHCRRPSVEACTCRPHRPM